MKRTYDRTMTMSNTDLQNATIKLFISDRCKYDENSGNETVVKYKGLTSWDIIEGGDEAQEIEKDADAMSIDPYHNYLVLHFKDGTTATFRNSFVDMFIR